MKYKINIDEELLKTFINKYSFKKTLFFVIYLICTGLFFIGLGYLSLGNEYFEQLYKRGPFTPVVILIVLAVYLFTLHKRRISNILFGLLYVEIIGRELVLTYEKNVLKEEIRKVKYFKNYFQINNVVFPNFLMNQNNLLSFKKELSKYK